ncbi:MAG: hypothetical protein O3B01_16100 [Planctomycetota bacterium]|nr:hypothetical protein [Planctomycetota bacterium]MDA1140096.1 hypothetical protein [Planctomycetota bacterium]
MTFFTILWAVFVSVFTADAEYLSHPPMRPLPAPSKRPLAAGPGFFADSRNGSDENPGTKAKPWKTIKASLEKLKPSHTLYLRGGVYYEDVDCHLKGAPDAPITIRSYPGELVAIDGGLREFLEDPAKCWEPFPDGAEGEFRSTGKYPGATRAAAIFADSFVPLQSYKFAIDLRENNIFWNLDTKSGSEAGIYCGPGVWYDSGSERIHIRLKHYELPALEKTDRYLGETDPRRLPLFVCLNDGIPLRIENAKLVRFQDLSVRGGSLNVYIKESADIELNNVTVNSVFPACNISDSPRLRIINSAFRGMSAPWSFRGHHKYRSMDIYLMSTGGNPLKNNDWEFAYSEFTDSHDGPHLGATRGLRFHHNLVENFNDDGLFLTARHAEAGDTYIYQNRLARCLTTLAFGYGRSSFRRHGKGVYLYRNVFDFMQPVHYGIPGPEVTRVPGEARLCGDHGGPTWEPMTFYHNTFLAAAPGWRGYALGLGYHMQRTTRRVFNNIFVVDKMPTQAAPEPGVDYVGDANLFWSLSAGPTFEGDFFAALRGEPIFKAVQTRYPPGLEANGIFADPLFIQSGNDWKTPMDLRLKKGSPAIDAGVFIPVYSPDPVAGQDQGKPDIGALPYGIEMFQYGQQSGRVFE